jgi:hypothetical protein
MESAIKLECTNKDNFLFSKLSNSIHFIHQQKTVMAANVIECFNVDLENGDNAE